jgi:hypothetical protein
MLPIVQARQISGSSRGHAERRKPIAHIGQQATCRRRQRSGAACNEPELCLCANGMIDIQPDNLIARHVGPLKVPNHIPDLPIDNINAKTRDFR